MKKRTALLMGCIAALLCAPVGFAIAQSAIPGSDAPTEQLETHEDPDPATNPIEEMDALNKAQAEGNAAAEAQAVSAMRAEILSRDSQADQEAAESAPPVAYVPPGTKTYIPPSLPEAAVKSCEKTLAEGSEEQLCELIVLHEEGKIRSGAFSAEEQSAALKEAK